MALGIIFTAIGTFTLAMLGLMLYVYIEFKRESSKTAGVLGALTHYDHKKNVRGRHHFYKNITDATYSYTVKGKVYTRKSSRYTTPKNSPLRVTIVYFRPFPYFSYIYGDNYDMGPMRYLVYAFSFFAFTCMFLGYGISWLIEFGG